MTVQCPNCGKVYEPDYADRHEAPENTIYREQHQTGICSNDCWNDWLGVDSQ